MNVYDFDGTIYKGDSSVDFYLYCLRKYPRILTCLPRQVKGVFLRVVGRCDTARMKELFFSFLVHLENPESCVRAFWQTGIGYVQHWYFAQKAPTDVIISASPEFLLRPLCEQLQIGTLIATRMDARNGKIIGKNCKGDEKVRRFSEYFPNAAIERFYSDSLSDAPLAELAAQAFIVKNENPRPWG